MPPPLPTEDTRRPSKPRVPESTRLEPRRTIPRPTEPRIARSRRRSAGLERSRVSSPRLHAPRRSSRRSKRHPRSLNLASFASVLVRVISAARTTHRMHGARVSSFEESTRCQLTCSLDTTASIFPFDSAADKRSSRLESNSARVSGNQRGFACVGVPARSKMTASPYVSRINQIDAAQLDDEIYKVLRSQVKRITEYRPTDGIDRWQPEIDALLKFLMWKFSLYRGKSTFGQQLLNLHYENIDRAKSLFYLILTVAPAYARDKLEGSDRARRLAAILDRVANATKLLGFLNFLVFLHRGTQPRVVEYLLGISSRSTTTHKPRNIGYSYMTRELLWHGLMELFTVGLPLINFHYLKHAAKRLLTRGSRGNATTVRAAPKMTVATKCAYCGETPIMPMHAGCEHLFCYYCLTAHFTATNEFLCGECGAKLAVEDARNYEP
ncbi:peroxisomal biogenesis factor 2 isoform X2 [Megalopta genalis]|uniref:peroxisomal biogenesis factor 2 isoform X2 n=1 Tax=Megalopta genalis TaxID=115081 RepID=UPI003FD05EA5